ncbi:MAG: M24 family metallopeptidase [Bacteroidetes bacterium]|nr:MAG: M24 family metallopeptidase [Bacteroidota bacterium]REK04652.1 MAG: M24 family metallopeptidase [Bacteroidota bacterium]REK36127.1 MAG: M24 family metallopeptidase [Bacteroidota bacterium]REK51502.1 MAG: M24 family metallopeptidase [Bacteroidota bacterium]
MKYKAIDKKLFIENRKKFVKHLHTDSVAFFNSNDEMPRSGDQNFPFRQQADLFWLTGIDQEQTILVLSPGHPLPEYREMLFLRKTNEHIAVWEGHKYTKEEAREASGINHVYWVDDFKTMLPVLMHHSNHVYINLNENDRFVTEVPYREERFASNLKSKYPNHIYERSGPLMAQLRTIKSNIEVDLMCEAIDITDKAFRRVLGFVKPGVMEYEIEAEIMHEFLRNRATGNAYYPIIASGASACVLHYNDNNKECKDGDVILMDFGAEYANYAADLTRSIPVNGKFSKRQKEVYNAVLRVMKEATSMLVEGNTILKYHEAVGKIMEQELIGLGLLKAADVKKQDPKQPLYKKYFMHGTSHFLGLDVHDIGNRYQPMKNGMVFTCEPGIYIPEEKLGIRIENNILLTSKGPKDLMKNIPIEVDEIEDLMSAGKSKTGKKVLVKN